MDRNRWGPQPGEPNLTMFLFVLTAVVTYHLTFTLPVYNACPEWHGVEVVDDPCKPCPTPIPLTDLEEVAIVGWPLDRMTAAVDTVARANVRGLEGTPYTITVVLDDRPWNVWEISRDRVGNWSCKGNGLALGAWPVGVPSVVAASHELHYYDISGRRLSLPPTRPGVYFWRLFINGIPTSTRKVLLVK